LFALLLPLAGLAQTSGGAAGRTRAPDNTPTQIYLTGSVRHENGSILTERVTIERVCNGIPRREGFADARGDFGFQVGAVASSTSIDANLTFDRVSPPSSSPAFQSGLSDRDLAGCEIRASVPGFVSDSITLGFRRALDNPYIGVIYLHPISKIDDGLREKLAADAAAAGKWEEVVGHTSVLFQQTTDVDANVYFYSAVANHYLGNSGLALEHAREAAERDSRFTNPKIHHVLGLLLMEKGEYAKAAKSLQLYLSLLPSAPDADSVRRQLAELSLKTKWIHGSEPCSANRDAPFEIRQYNEDTFVLRQNKCLHYEAPFIYLLFGEDKAFLFDSGAAPRADSGIAFPIRQTVQKIVEDRLTRRGKTEMTLIVAHSHAHGDHTGGDSQFENQPNTRVVGTRPADVQEFFGIKDWPSQRVPFDLGGRVLDVIPIPGHDAASIAVYDRQTGFLLTGDTLYPGRLYIRDWPDFKASIERLAIFVRTHEVSYVLGAHIEMSSAAGKDYPVRTTYQPDEHPLRLLPAHILELFSATSKMGDAPARETHDSFILYPR
jgi:glyoxylase-like metal-dependent hydrolase (beta-lactamase superfamily II)